MARGRSFHPRERRQPRAIIPAPSTLIANQRMIACGGEYLNSGALQTVSDVWSLSLPASGGGAGGRSRRGTLPFALPATSAIYDGANQRMMVFGSCGPGDVRMLGLTGSGDERWTQLAPSGTPPDVFLAGHSAIYDSANQRAVVFGAETDWSHNDVWSLSLAGGGAWKHLAPAGTPPAARYLHSAIYDGTNQRMVVFGGATDELITFSMSGC